MNSKQYKLIKDSLLLVQPLADQVAKTFYSHLFEIAPPTRKLFKGDLNLQGTMLITSLSLALNGLDDMKSILPSVQALGERHRSYGVKAEYYRSAVESFLWALEHHLGDKFTPALREAWTLAFSSLVNAMLSVYDSK